MLRNLERLYVSIMLICPTAQHQHSMDGEFMAYLLEPLEEFRALDFQVEITEPVAPMRKRLGVTRYRLVQHVRNDSHCCLKV